MDNITTEDTLSYLEPNFPSLIIGLILILLLGIGSYYLGKMSKTTSSPEPIPTTFPTVQTNNANDGFMTYKNNDRGFSFHYPQSLILSSRSTEDFISFLQLQDGIMVQRLAVEVLNKYKDLPLVEILKQEKLLFDETGFIYENIIIDGRETLLAVKNESLKDVCNFSSEKKMRRIKFAVIRNSDYVLVFIPNDSCGTLQNDWFGSIPYSIKF